MSTIVILVLAMSMLVLGIILVRNIFTSATDSVGTIDDQVKNEINNLFGTGNNKIAVSLGSQNTAKIKQGTENFGVAFGFSPDDPAAWGANLDGCTYTVTAVDQTTYCIKKGWTTPAKAIKTGDDGVAFDETVPPNGYALMKIDIPETVPECLQRFSILVECTGHPLEKTSTYFDIEVIKKGIF